MSDRGVETVKISVSAWLHRLTSYLRRIPLLTRAVLVAVPIVHLLGSCGLPLAGMWSLDPAVMDLTQSTYLLRLPFQLGDKGRREGGRNEGREEGKGKEEA